LSTWRGAVQTETAPKSRRWPWLAFVFCAACILACSSGDSAQAPHPGRGVYVPLSWSQARTIDGHDVHVGRKQVACSDCHAIGESDIGAVSPVRCASCHEKEARIAHAALEASARLKTELKSDCTLCHRFSDDSAVLSLETSVEHQLLHVHQPGDCVHCHDARQGLTPAVRVHDTGKCLDCHRPHEDATPQSGPCQSCHEAIRPTHAVDGKTPNQVCTTCHQKQHAAGREALTTCVPCHQKAQPVVPPTALFEGGHVACVACHQPHQFGKEKAVACRTCHEDLAVLGAAHAAGHRECTNCHSAHDVQGSPDQACARCHTDKHPDHPKKGRVGACVGCHDPHPAGSQVRTRVRDCSTCHQNAASDQQFHGGTKCKSCHTPHDFVREVADRSACAACHATELARAQTLAGHQACEACHTGLPHRPQQELAGCASCHGAQGAQANKGHGQCTSCHEPHAGRVSTDCSSCHQPEQRTAPAGHRACRNCHEPHSGKAAKPCSSCHSPQAATPHGQMSATCADCHRAHGPGRVAEPPECKSCHQPAQLAGLHQVPQHTACGKCHTGHGAPPGSRKDGCLSCHADRKRHFPEAPSCASCHLFGRTR
jgi:hypothetical protein